MMSLHDVIVYDVILYDVIFLLIIRFSQMERLSSKYVKM